MELSIIDGYLEIEFDNGLKSTISMAYAYRNTSMEIRKILDQYQTHKKDAFDQPNMIWDPSNRKWYMLDEISTIRASTELENFVLLCRRNRHVS